MIDHVVVVDWLRVNFCHFGHVVRKQKVINCHPVVDPLFHLSLNLTFVFFLSFLLPLQESNRILWLFCCSVGWTRHDNGYKIARGDED